MSGLFPQLKISCWSTAGKTSPCAFDITFCFKETRKPVSWVPWLESVMHSGLHSSQLCLHSAVWKKNEADERNLNLLFGPHLFIHLLLVLSTLFFHVFWEIRSFKSYFSTMESHWGRLFWNSWARNPIRCHWYKESVLSFVDWIRCYELYPVFWNMNYWAEQSFMFSLKRFQQPNTNKSEE